MQMGESDNLEWELLFLRQSSLHSRLLLVVPPATNISWSGTSWSSFTEQIRSIGYGIDIPAPGPGSVVTFHEDGSAFILTRNATTANDYVSPIAAWLFRGEVIGRIKETVCPYCDKSWFASLREIDTGIGLCDFCRKDLGWGSRDTS
jgi:hypothetical protein